MKKCCMMILAALLAILPSAVGAQGLPELLEAAQEGVGEGLAEGVRQAGLALDSDLSLTLTTGEARLMEGQSLALTLTVENPRPVDTPVTIELNVPQRLSMAQPASWQTVIPAATLDAAAGTLTPSVTTFTRELALAPGGTSEQVTLEAEMSLGTRFYRARTALELCVSDVSAQAVLLGGEDGRARPGEALAYRVEVTNAGLADKDVAVELILPEGVTLDGALPEGFARVGSRVSGQVCAQAAQMDEAGAAASLAALEFPVTVDADALDGDGDAMRLLTGTLRVGGERIALPRVQVCAPQVTAKLIAETDSLEAGEATELRIVVVNTGLADADVRLTCVLPKGLTLAGEKTEATPGELAAVLPGDDGGAPAAQALSLTPTDAPKAQADGSLVYTLHIDAAREEEGGLCAATQTIRLSVVAQEPQDFNEQVLGASLAWSADGGQTQLGEAVALRVSRQMALGLTRDEWNGIFWAGLLLTVTVACLCAAVHADNRREDCYPCD